MLWHLEGPDQRWYSKKEVAGYLGVSVRVLERLIAEGRFPRGNRASARSPPRWSGLDLACYDHIRPDSREPPVYQAGGTSPGGEQPGTNHARIAPMELFAFVTLVSINAVAALCWRAGLLPATDPRRTQ